MTLIFELSRVSDLRDTHTNISKVKPTLKSQHEEYTKEVDTRRNQHKKMGYDKAADGLQEGSIGIVHIQTQTMMNMVNLVV